MTSQASTTSLRQPLWSRQAWPILGEANRVLAPVTSHRHVTHHGASTLREGFLSASSRYRHASPSQGHARRTSVANVLLRGYDRCLPFWHTGLCESSLRSRPPCSISSRTRRGPRDTPFSGLNLPRPPAAVSAPSLPPVPIFAKKSHSSVACAVSNTLHLGVLSQQQPCPSFGLRPG